MVVSPDGKYAYVGSRSDDRISIVNLQGLYLKTTIANITKRKFPDGTLDGLAISPDSKYLYVSDLQSDYVAIIDLRENRVITEITVDQGPMDLDISADGRYLFTLATGTSAIAVNPTLDL